MDLLVRDEMLHGKRTFKLTDNELEDLSMLLDASIIIILTLLFTTLLIDDLLSIFITIAIGVIIMLFKRKKIDHFAKTSDLRT